MTARARLLKKYGLTQRQYAAMFQIGHRACWICWHPPKRGRRLNIDHDHVTGRVRGLLCFRCNRYLVGRYRQAGIFQAAADYLASDFDGRKI